MKTLLKILALLLLLSSPVLAQTPGDVTGRFWVGVLSARPTCSSNAFDTLAHNGDIYNDTDDGNVWKCFGGVWSSFNGGGGGGNFSALTSGTNLTAAMLVGTGASLGPTGSGTVTANAFSGLLNASNIPTGTNCGGGQIEIGIGVNLTPVCTPIYYQTIQSNTVSLIQRPVWNAVLPFTCVDNPGGVRTDCSIPVAIGVGGSHASGLVPDPGASGSASDYLARDMTYRTSVSAATVKPDPSSAVLYVAGICNGGGACLDSNDGLSPGSAMLTIYHAICSLPGGNCTPGTQIAGAGTVYVLGNSNNANLVNASPTSGCGIWLMGVNDPNYASPPACWLKASSGKTGLSIVGVSQNESGSPNGHNPRIAIYAGSHADRNHPAVWLSAWQTSLVISNIFAYANSGQQGRPVVIGECSTGLRDNTCQSSTTIFNNDGFATDTTVGTSGPCTDIVAASLWFWFRDYGCSGIGFQATGGYLADNAAGMLISGSGGQIQITDSNFQNGGIKVTGGANLYASNITEEGDFVHTVPPVVWYTVASTGSTNCVLTNIGLADGGGQPIAVQNDAGGPGCTVSLTGTGGIQGPAVALGVDQPTLVQQTSSPGLQGQVGFFDGWMVGNTSVARNITGLVPARFTNLAFISPANWAITQTAGVSTLTTGVTDKFGGIGAATASSTNAANENIYFRGGCGGGNYTPTSGDWVVTGGFIQTTLVSGTPAININWCGSSGPTISKTISAFPMIKGDGLWQFTWVASKISQTGTLYALNSVATFNLGSPTTVFAPVLYVIPAGTISDSEVAEFAMSMGAQDTSCPVGSICNVTGHPVSVDALNLRFSVFTGSMGAGTLTGNQTYTFPNVSGTVSLFTGSITAGNNVCASGTAGLITTVGCTGGGGTGTVIPSSQFSNAYYDQPGSVAHIAGVPGPTAPNGVPSFWVTIPSANLSTAPQPVLAGVPGRVVTGASDTILFGDRVGRVKYTNAGATSISLPGPGTPNFGSNFCFRVKVQGSTASDTIIPTAGTINGVGSLVMLQGQAGLICSFDNSNYEADVFESGGLIAGTAISFTRSDNGGLTINSTAGGGTVTHTAGALTSGQLVIGNAAADIKVGDISGDCTTSGSTAITCTKLNGTSFAGTQNDLVAFGASNTPIDTAVLYTNLVTASSNFVNGDVIQGAGANKTTSDTGVLAINLVTATANPAFSNQLCASTNNTTKACTFKSYTDVTATGYAGQDSVGSPTYTACPTNTATALTTGMVSTFLPKTANATTAPSYNLCTLGAKTITKHGTAVLSINDLTTIAIAEVKYDGTGWELQNPMTEGSGGTPALSSLLAAAASNTIGNANFPQRWNWAQTTDSQIAMRISESSAATGGTITGNLANQALLVADTTAGSTETPFYASQGTLTTSLQVPAAQIKTTWNGSGVYQGLVINLVDTAHGVGSHVLNIFGGASGLTSLFFVDTAGGTSQPGVWRLTGSPATGANSLPMAYLNAGAAPSTFSSNGTEFGINSPSGFTGNMFDFRVNGGSSVASLDYQGNLFAAGTVDGKAIVNVSTTTPCTLGTAGTNCSAVNSLSGYNFNGQTGAVGTAQTYNLPTPSTGLQYCVGNTYNTVAAAPNTGILTVATHLAGEFIIFTDGTLSASGGNVTSGGAAADAACFIGQDATHWMMYVQRGTWTKH